MMSYTSVENNMTSPSTLPPSMENGTVLKSTESASVDSSLADSLEQEGEQFLQFQLVPETRALLPMAQLAEVLTIPIGQITPIPQVPSWMMGVYNWRSEALWMIDLASLIGLTPWHQQPLRTNYSAVVLLTGLPKTLVTHAADQAIGLVINQAEIISRCDPDTFIQSLPSLSNDIAPPCLEPFLRGYHTMPDGKQVSVLGGDSILAEIAKQNAKQK